MLIALIVNKFFEYSASLYIIHVNCERRKQNKGIVIAER